MKKGCLNPTNKSFTLSLILLVFLSFNQKSNALSFQDVAQSFDEYQGRVIGDDTKKVLIFANISVKNSNISTITNKEGQFTLKVPKSLSNSSILISYLGYKTQEVSLNSLRGKDNTITLEAIATELSQININAATNARSLVKSALNNLGDKYVNEKMAMTAFYRETIKKRNKNASLAEAVVKIYKEPYSSSRSDAVELIKSRKNTNYSRLDTLAVKLQGGPFSALYSDIVKYQDYIFSDELFEYYTFSFDASTELNNRSVFVVNFKQLPNIVTPLYSGKIYIDAETLALVSADYSLNVENKDEAVKLFLRKKPRLVKVEPEEALYRVDYKSTSDGKWYYSYSNVQLAFRVKWRKKLFGSRYSLNIEMAITDWTKNFTSTLNKDNRLRPSIILSDKASGFSDPEFWGEYNIIEPEKSIESAIRKISRQLEKIEKKKE
ncbi:carboxypeptidase-like regulatory domain-containing protein [Pontimicrobium aquaticum]|uniref:Carboxypeptidase-like regulatory domain-containing protein n=1 Tax=Pontimicrobium aquaticum TaxID=2565367 RepID=A0A4U0EY49_9FLAO|nr:carboxypeptidase-like regulatory domain-containing protein [Pontimicrobium aquaticum]TJY36324.1 carboxypeptidase-like regulatory domain-containing protein [Pontimicrobium aquaticum]